MRKECYECTYNYGNMYVATMNLFIAYGTVSAKMSEFYNIIIL